MSNAFPCAFSPWSPSLGDANPIGWAFVMLYLLVAWSCARAARASRSAPPLQRRERVFWWLCAVVMGFLAINKQLDLQTLLTDVGRCIAVDQGWYEGRREVQRGFLAAMAVISVASVAGCWLVLRKTFARTGLAVLGLGLVCLFVVVRAASFHDFDALLGSSVRGLGIAKLLEVTGPLLVLIAAVHPGRQALS